MRLTSTAFAILTGLSALSPLAEAAIDNVTTGTREFTDADHLGSTRLITDDAGTVKNRLDFSAWGEILRADGPDLPRYGWCGAYGYQDDRLPPRSSDAGPGSDLAFGLLHIGPRYYDPSAGAMFLVGKIVGTYEAMIWMIGEGLF